MIWHAYHVRPRASLVKLADEMIEAYGPDAVAVPIQTVKKITKRSRTKTEIETVRRHAMVPGWAFLATPTRPEHRDITGVLLQDDRPYPIPAYQIARMMTAAMVTIIEGRPEAVYSIGQVVTPRGTAWDNHRLSIASWDGETYRVTSTLFGGHHVEITLRPDQIAA